MTSSDGDLQDRIEQSSKCSECGGSGTFPHHVDEPARPFHLRSCSHAVGQDRQEPSKRRWLDLARQAIAQRPHPPCANCLRPAAISCPIGNDIGTQRDPAWESIWLCPDCIEALIDDLALFHERYATERTVRRDGS